MGISNLEMPQEFDDPNTLISNIVREIKLLEIPFDYSQNKLKSGAGEACLYVLDVLSKRALEESGFVFQKLRPIETQEEPDDNEENLQADEAEITADQFDDDVQSAADYDDDTGVLVDMQAVGSDIPEVETDKQLQGIIHTKIEPTSFKQEVERVTPQLKITLRADAKDWRMHMDQIQKNQAGVKNEFENVRPYLDNTPRIGECTWIRFKKIKLESRMKITRTFDRIEARERHINQQLESLLNQYRQQQDRLAEATERYREAGGGVVSRTETLQRISEEIDQIKQQIEEQGAKNVDGAPILKIKQAIAKMEQNILTMTVQIAVIEQSLLQSQLSDRAIASVDFMPGDYM
uniref:Intraflagellar transport protein 57 homolog n=1 Tax=Acrobeloides nanus TaxID=290746 RepID=A0A914CP53_9BILA